MLKFILFITLSFSLYAENFQTKEAPEQHFLIFKTTIKSTKDIGRHAQRNIPALFKEAKDKKLEITGQIHHFYKGNELEIALPVKNSDKYKGIFQLVKKEPYRYAVYKHNGPVSKIGESWDKLHSHSVNKGAVLQGGIEIYTSGTKSLLNKNTTIELRNILADKSKFTQCIIKAVGPKTNAETSGLKVGDIIKDYSGNSIKNSGDLILAINKNSKKAAGIRVTIIRKGKELQIDVKAGKLGIALENR